MIPAWNIHEVLPPVRPGAVGHDPDRSPYVATMIEVVDRFATSPERIGILRGLLAYREAFMKAGAAQGFQWLDGSFMEKKEVLELCAPNDVDAVTFFQLPPGVDELGFLSGNPDLFDHDAVKTNFLVDGYPFVLGGALTAVDVRLVSYWYSMWSHRRTGMWKGFLEVNLSVADDASAAALLDHIAQGGTNP